MEKANLRIKILEQLSHLNSDQKKEWDAQISKKAIAILKEENVRVLHCFIPMPKEVSTWGIIEYCWENDIVLIAPKVQPKKLLSHHIIKSAQELVLSKRGILEPSTPIEKSLKPDTIIVPGLAFNTSLHRLGYGGGYYDRFLAQHLDSIKIGLAYEFMESQVFKTESYDISLNRIINNSK
jgi:5-formyltetrahydrofolate cyclo-ligase